MTRILAAFVLLAAPAMADPFADAVVGYQIGLGGGAGSCGACRS